MLGAPPPLVLGLWWTPYCCCGVSARNVHTQSFCIPLWHPWCTCGCGSIP